MAGKKYKALIERFALRPIRSREGLSAANLVAGELIRSYSKLDEEERDYFAVLTSLISQYESANIPLPISRATPLDYLKYLMEENSLKQADLAKILGVSSGRASEICNGHRELTKTHVALLARRFCVNASVFLPVLDAKQQVALSAYEQARSSLDVGSLSVHEESYAHVLAASERIKQTFAALTAKERELLLKALAGLNS